MSVTIVADQGTHLLISQDDRFTIIERRGDRLFTCHDGKREGIWLDDISNISTILDDRDWMTDEAVAHAAFEAIVARGTQLGQSMR